MREKIRASLRRLLQFRIGIPWRLSMEHAGDEVTSLTFPRCAGEIRDSLSRLLRGLDPPLSFRAYRERPQAPEERPLCSNRGTEGQSPVGAASARGCRSDGAAEFLGPHDYKDVVPDGTGMRRTHGSPPRRGDAEQRGSGHRAAMTAPRPAAERGTVFTRWVGERFRPLLRGRGRRSAAGHLVYGWTRR